MVVAVVKALVAVIAVRIVPIGQLQLLITRGSSTSSSFTTSSTSSSFTTSSTSSSCTTSSTSSSCTTTSRSF